ncbi:putative F-box domain, leucine-rich repeat domain, L domain-containing protein [Lupinus albus]|uniref:Putative F-box domain, leucine-rich repeat domain, L domain-containing protein n=1 Tax=Lupinus albus TaxID=3870 RepID=A0A6A4MK30_LUPAL|nr:putative F-box domain, leucine-rich repeat domain, L domain-containing protein [Lupinus albus]
MENFCYFISWLCKGNLKFIKWKIESKRKPNWVELPRDITRMILKKLSVIDFILNAQYVSCEWRNICKDPLMWCTIKMAYVWINTDRCLCLSKLNKICRYVIDLSSGHLNHIFIYDFGDNNLLEYIVNSSNEIRILGLKYCSIEEKKLNVYEFAKKLPQLNELSVSYCAEISKDFLEAIGICCPRITKLILCKWLHKNGEIDEDAFAIAKNMPQLTYLHLDGIKITNVGLLAILDGCPHLKWLHILVCPYLNLKGSLLQRCRQQIKYFHFD